MGFKDQWKLKTHQIVHTDHKERVYFLFALPFLTKFDTRQKAIHMFNMFEGIPHQVQFAAT